MLDDAADSWWARGAWWDGRLGDAGVEWGMPEAINGWTGKGSAQDLRNRPSSSFVKCRHSRRCLAVCGQVPYLLSERADRMSLQSKVIRSFVQLSVSLPKKTPSQRVADHTPADSNGRWRVVCVLLPYGRTSLQVDFGKNRRKNGHVTVGDDAGAEISVPRCRWLSERATPPRQTTTSALVVVRSHSAGSQ